MSTASLSQSSSLDDSSSIKSTSTTSSSSSQHKRSLSATLLSRVPFLRPAAQPSSSTQLAETRAANTSPNSTNTPASNQDEETRAQTPPLPKKGRTRTGSLRKTALLGGRVLRLEKRTPGLETITSPRLDTRAGSMPDDTGLSTMTMSPDSDDSSTPRASYENNELRYAQVHMSSDENLSAGTHPNAHKARADHLLLGGGELSTTDDEEALSAPRAAVVSSSSTGPGIQALAEESYFAAADSAVSVLRRRSGKKAKSSPLATIPAETLGPAEDWDYAETERWGWVILVVTWSVFVVGVGSCFEVWSWAWDVGQTPYAPPELEDDPTLPVVGYYPALLVLTGVMAWVWVIVAWVGMKYFKHAKISGDGGA